MAWNSCFTHPHVRLETGSRLAFLWTSSSEMISPGTLSQGCSSRILVSRSGARLTSSRSRALPALRRNTPLPLMWSGNWCFLQRTCDNRHFNCCAPSLETARWHQTFTFQSVLLNKTPGHCSSLGIYSSAWSAGLVSPMRPRPRRGSGGGVRCVCTCVCVWNKCFPKLCGGTLLLIIQKDNKNFQDNILKKT